MKKETPEWYKIKGYPHITASAPMSSKASDILIRQIENPNFVANYSFYPLLHVKLKERKYKKHPDDPNKRIHSYWEQDKRVKTIKVRPIHYANHKDALIFGYYASILGTKYEQLLVGHKGLSDCITAYRKIPIGIDGKNKGTIHFAFEAFSAIKAQVLDKGSCAVLTFDIKDFFPSLDHNFLREKWKEVLNVASLEPDHQNVFRSATRYSYIYRDDLRLYRTTKGYKSGFNEKELSKIRNVHGINAFFETPQSFRQAVKSGKLHVYPNSKKNNSGEVIGIPQGLPISATLANIYLLDFDRDILQDLVVNRECFYRRYSDDIVIICSSNDIDYVKEYVEQEMKKSRVSISIEKTEQYIFRYEEEIVQVYKLREGKEERDKPFVYLGFEFYGYKTLIKSANLSKFYRRMIYSIKKKCKNIRKIAEQSDSKKRILYKRYLYKLYRNVDLDKEYRIKKFKKYELQETGNYKLRSTKKKDKFKSNYFSYAKRAAKIMNEPKIDDQIKGEKRVFNQAIQKHLNT